MNKIPVAVIEKDKRTIDRILEIIESFNNAGKIKYSNDIYDLEIILSKKIPTIILIGPSFQFAELEKMLGSYNSSLNHIKMILLSENLSPDLLLSAIKLNVHDVLKYPVTDDDLKDSFERACSMFHAITGSSDNNQHVCKKIMFFSTKGGSGNTFLATNFAIVLKQKLNKEVTIYDLNYQFGDVALMLNVFPKNTIFDLMTFNKFDEDNMNVFLMPHNSGIKILPAPIDPTQGEAIELETSKKVFDSLSRFNDYLVIDAPASFTPEVLAFLDNIDFMFIVATKDVPSIKNLKICFQLLEKLGYPKEKIFVVLNRADSKVDIEIDEIEKTIKRSIDIKIPSDRIVPLSINKGIPVVTGARTRRSPVNKNILKMFDFLILKEKELAEKEEKSK